VPAIGVSPLLIARDDWRQLNVINLLLTFVAFCKAYGAL